MCITFENEGDILGGPGLSDIYMDVARDFLLPEHGVRRFALKGERGSEAATNTERAGSIRGDARGWAWGKRGLHAKPAAP